MSRATPTPEALLADSRAGGCTLDGEPAMISGTRNRFATVSRRDGRGGDVQYSWEAVARVLASSRAFSS